MNMTLKDKVTLSQWLNSNVSLSEVESMESIGIVGNIRFSEHARDVYKFLWAWSAPRFHGSAGTMQERVYKLHGMAALNRRYARINRIVQQLKGGK